jgi:surfeit locus 1 family protein
MPETANRAARLSWHSDWRTTAFTLLLIPIFVALGFWQLGRAEEKHEISQRWAQRSEQSPVPLVQLRGDAQALAFRRVLLQGSFIADRDFLLDNRIYQGRYGFEVLSPLRLTGGDRIVLVNRGWIAGDPARLSRPQIPLVSGEVELQGSLYVPPGEPYTLGDRIGGDDWPRLILALDVPAMGNMLEEMVYPYSVRLAAQSPASLTVDWPVINVSPSKHQAYAVQWFAMALALALMWFWRSTNIAALWRGRRGGIDE